MGLDDVVSRAGSSVGAALSQLDDLVSAVDHLPELLDSAEELYADPDAMRALADELTRVADGSNDLPKILDRLSVVKFGPESWCEAQQLQEAMNQVGHAVIGLAGQLTVRLNEAAAAIRESADAYKVTESTTRGLINQVSGS
jgi:hypothetical protein